MQAECRPCFHFVRHLRFFLLGNVFFGNRFGKEVEASGIGCQFG